MKSRLFLLFGFTIVPVAVCASVCSTGHGTQPVIDHYISDPGLHRRWAVLENCAHPEQPWTIASVPWQSAEKTVLPVMQTRAAAKEILVPSGGRVRLWRITGKSRIELSGTAIEAGCEGQMIHVKTGKSGVILAGTVRGLASVELSNPLRWTDAGEVR